MGFEIWKPDLLKAHQDGYHLSYKIQTSLSRFKMVGTIFNAILGFWHWETYLRNVRTSNIFGFWIVCFQIPTVDLFNWKCLEEKWINNKIHKTELKCCSNSGKWQITLTCTGTRLRVLQVELVVRKCPNLKFRGQSPRTQCPEQERHLLALKKIIRNFS